MNIAVFVSGGGTNLQAIIDAIDSGYLSNIKISLVVSSKADVYALERAKNSNIKSVVISKKENPSPKSYDKAIIIALENENIELIVLAGFLSFLGPDIVRQYKDKIINVHPSLIPAFSGEGMYGIKPHEAAIKRGVKVSGATVHFVNEEYDCGPIIFQKVIEVFENDTPESLQKRVMNECEQVILPKAIKLYSENKIRINDNKVYIV